MQRNLTYLIFFLMVGLAGLFWMAPNANGRAPLTPRSLAFAASLSATQAATATQPVTTPVVLTTTAAVTTTTAVTKVQTVTETTSVTTTVAVTATPSATATTGVTTTIAVTTTQAVTSTPTVTETSGVTTTPAVTTTPPATTTASVTTTTAVTATPAASAPVVGNCQQLVVNGDFEARTGWRLPVTPYPGAYSTEKPFEGASSLRLGLLDNNRNVFSFSTGYQLIRLPANAKTITLKALVWRANTNAKDRDFQYLIVDPQRGRPHRVFLALHNAQKWEPVVYNLTPFKGQLVRVVFGAYNNGRAGKAVMYVDAVSIESCK